MTAPQIPDSASPYWLRLYGHWVRLQGIMPMVDKGSDRAFSELTTVDGYRYEQRAPRGPRSWALDYRYATAAATSALESAAYDNNYDDPDMRTLLLDTNEAKINMVPPDLNTAWSVEWALTPNFAVLNVGVGTDMPIWQPTYDTGPVVGGASQGRSVSIPVRAGVTYTAVVWTVFPIAGRPVLRVLVDGVVVGTANTLGTGTNANPEKLVVTFTASVDGLAEVQVGGVSPALGFSYYSAGLMVYEGDCAQDYYRAGRRMPCSVSVQDPSTKTNLIWRDCDPCRLPREHTSWVIHEVAMDAVTPLDVGVS